MPMAKYKLKSVARLAMGTAILTVISGCENNVANSYSDLVSVPPAASDPVSVPIVETPPEANIAAAPESALPEIAVPDYVAPGAPTYTESSQAANVETFESIYGAPVTDAASGTLLTAEPYSPPSYDDGTVATQAIPAPPSTATVAEAVTPSYTQRTIAALEPATFGVETTAVEGLVYGESLTSSSYTVTSEPISLEADVTDNQVYGEAASQPLSFESYTVDTVPLTGSETSLPANDETPEFETATLSTSYIDTLPLIDASALSEEPALVETIPALVSTVIATEPLLNVAPIETAAFNAPETKALESAAPSYNGVEIISNDELLAAYSDAAPSVGFEQEPPALSGQYTVTSVERASVVATAPVVEIAALAAPKTVASPLPRPKQSAAVVTPVVLDLSPATAPLPRRRPSSAERVYATLDAPVPQPRPIYKEPMAVATTAGNYVSIGALKDFDTPKAADGAVMADAKKMLKEVPKASAEGVQEASLRTVAPKPKALKMDKPVALDTETSELSGTSWRLTKVDAAMVSVNAELHFDGSSGFAGGQGPCNSYGGEFINIGQGRFSMDNIFSTDVGCSSLDVEKKYLEALESAERYEIAPDFSDMTLLDAQGRAIAQFKAF